MEQVNLDLIRKDLDELKIEISFIKEQLLDNEANLEISDEIENEIKESREMKGKDLISHEDVLKRYYK